MTQSQSMEQRFSNAIQNGDNSAAAKLLEQDRTLAGKNFHPDSLHTDGFPLYQAAQKGNYELVKLLLGAGADPDAKLDTVDPREVGMPLMHALENRRLDIVHLLLDHNPDLNAFPYCATPFVDCILNATWDHPEYEDEVKQLVRQCFDNYLGPDEGDTSCSESADGVDAPEMIQLLRRVVAMGGQPSLFTVVRHEHHELIEALLRTCAEARGTAMDWPRGTVFQNLCNGASWTGYPKTLDDCRAICPTLYTTDVARHCVERAIRSHNRDGGIDQYHQLIHSQLEYLKNGDDLKERYSNDEPFVPLHWLAEDFIEPKNYGFKCEELSTPEDLIRLAKLFLDYGFSIESVNPKSSLTVLETTDKENQTAYASYLRDNGAKQ